MTTFAPEDIALVTAELPGKSTKKDDVACSILDALYEAGLFYPYGPKRLVLDTRTPTHEVELGSGVTAEYNNDTLIALTFAPGWPLEVQAA